MLRATAVRDLATAHPNVDLSSYELRKPLPDDRSVRYYLANRLCQVDFTETSRGTYVVRGLVGGSMRQIVYQCLLELTSHRGLLKDAHCMCANG
jgi:hypothetical protein